MPEPTLEESIAYLMQQVPAPVQEFILTKMDDTILDLMAAHELHIDQAGGLKRELLLMLLGQEKPKDFSQALIEEGIPATTVSEIINDVNESVFKKLRAQERMEGVAPAAYRTQEPRPDVPVMQVGEPPANLPGQPETVVPPPPPQPVAPPPPPAIPAVAPTFTYIPEMQPPPPMAPTPIYSTYASDPVATQLDPRPYMRTMATDMELASQGGQSAPAQPFQTAYIPVTFAAPPAYAPAPAAQAQPAQPAYQATPQPVSPPPQPVAPPPPARTYAPPVTAPVRLTPIDRSHGDAPLTKEFGNDPYREPIE